MRSVHTCAIGLSLLLALLFTAGTSADDSGSKVYIKEVGVFLVLPEDYSLERDEEFDRGGAFACYSFYAPDMNFPALILIQFFSKKSIRRVEKKCAKREDYGGEHYCATGEYPTTSEYYQQKEALKNPRKSKTKYQLKRFGNRNFIVSDHKSMGGDGFYREYRTFLNDTMIAILISWLNESQAKMADGLFANLKILKQ